MKKYFGQATALSIVIATVFVVAQVQAAPAQQQQEQIETQVVAPTYRIFATREGLVGRQTANGHIIQPRDHFVALPSWSVLSPQGSYEYQVRITYKGRSTIAPVWDVGPWNTNDDYWSPNRRYSDLPVGLPMAQAARLNGYNGGRDERGRVIQDPNGIDIADGAFWDALGMQQNDWVEVTFLWQGADPGAGNAQPISNPAPAPAPAPPTATPVPAKPVNVDAGATAVDNGTSGYTANGGTWYTANCGMNGTHQWTYSTTDAAKSENLASWEPTLPLAGFYELKAYVPECGEAAATGKARYTVTHDGAETEVVVDQASAAGGWTSLGTYHFGGDGDTPMVKLSDLAGDSKRAVRFDAMAWVPQQDSAAPDATITAITADGNGYMVKWGGTDDVSGIATYDVQVRQLPNGGWTDWQRETTETKAWFGPHEGKNFAFRVRGHDWAGNVEPWPANADMDTTGIGGG